MLPPNYIFTCLFGNALLVIMNQKGRTKYSGRRYCPTHLFHADSSLPGWMSFILHLLKARRVRWRNRRAGFLRHSARLLLADSSEQMARWINEVRKTPMEDTDWLSAWSQPPFSRGLTPGTFTGATGDREILSASGRASGKWWRRDVAPAQGWSRSQHW